MKVETDMGDIITKLDWFTALWLSLLVISWLVRLLMNVPGRLTSWGGFLIVAAGVTFFRWAALYGIAAITDNQVFIRAGIYIIVTGLQLWDWYLFARLTPAERTEIKGLMDILKKKERKETK